MIRFGLLTVWFLLFTHCADGVATTADAKEGVASDQAALYAQLLGDVRCPACQNPDLVSSEESAATDMRREILARVQLGQSEAEVRTFLQQRYGDKVFVTPPFSGATLFLWLIPGAVIVLGAFSFWRTVQRSRR